MLPKSLAWNFPDYAAYAHIYALLMNSIRMLVSGHCQVKTGTTACIGCLLSCMKWCLNNLGVALTSGRNLGSFFHLTLRKDMGSCPV